MIYYIIGGLLLCITTISCLVLLYRAYSYTLKRLAISLAGIIVLHKTLKLTLQRVEVQEKLIQEYDTWIGDRRDDVNKMVDTLNSIERKELFIADDEIGVIFNDIANVIKSFEKEVIVDSKSTTNITPTDKSE